MMFYQMDVYKLVAVVMHLGEVKFKKRSSKDDQVMPLLMPA